MVSMKVAKLQGIPFNVWLIARIRDLSNGARRRWVAPIPWVLLALVLTGCDLNLMTQTTNIDQGSTPTADLPLGCEVATVEVESLSGGSVKAGRTITFAATPRTGNGSTLTDECLRGPVRVEAIGECVIANPGASAALSGTDLYASAVGECKARFSYGGATGTSPAVQIVP